MLLNEQIFRLRSRIKELEETNKNLLAYDDAKNDKFDAIFKQLVELNVNVKKNDISELLKVMTDVRSLLARRVGDAGEEFLEVSSPVSSRRTKSKTIRGRSKKPDQYIPEVDTSNMKVKSKNKRVFKSKVDKIEGLSENGEKDE